MPRLKLEKGEKTPKGKKKEVRMVEEVRQVRGELDLLDIEHLINVHDL